MEPLKSFSCWLLTAITFVRSHMFAVLFAGFGYPRCLSAILEGHRCPVGGTCQPVVEALAALEHLE